MGSLLNNRATMETGKDIETGCPASDPLHSDAFIPISETCPNQQPPTTPDQQHPLAPHRQPTTLSELLKVPHCSTAILLPYHMLVHR